MFKVDEMSTIYVDYESFGRHFYFDLKSSPLPEWEAWNVPLLILPLSTNFGISNDEVSPLPWVEMESDIVVVFLEIYIKSETSMLANV